MSTDSPGMTHDRPVLVIGLDCAAPEFVFHHPDYDLPNLHALMERGSWGKLRSCDPPITVPAWSCMMSGRDPGALGIYGFRNRRSYDAYDDLGIATSNSVKAPRVWDLAGDAGKKVCVVGVPQTFPVQPVNGCLVSGLLTPGQDVECTYPPELRDELIASLGEIQFDVADFRTEDKEQLFKRILLFMENRFNITYELMLSKPNDFFMMVEMGLDRLHHAFWRFADPAHPRFEEENPFRWYLKEYYERMDEHIGKLIALAGPDSRVMVVSDHGAKAMHGGIRLNQWLIDQGYLVLKEAVTSPQPFRTDMVNWSKTIAWGDGGYYGRIFLNVKDREPEGIVSVDEVDAVAKRIQGEVEAMLGPSGSLMGNRAYRPNELYSEVQGIAPDLLVYFGDLHWRSLGGVGEDSVYAETNDTGPDDANHAMDGIVILSEGGGASLEEASLMDITPTLLDWMGVRVPKGLSGISLVSPE